MNVRHFLKPDHLCFLLMLPAILLRSKDHALILWGIALGYDIFEQKTGKEQ